MANNFKDISRVQSLATREAAGHLAFVSLVMHISLQALFASAVPTLSDGRINHRFFRADRALAA